MKRYHQPSNNCTNQPERKNAYLIYIIPMILFLGFALLLMQSLAEEASNEQQQLKSTNRPPDTTERLKV